MANDEASTPRAQVNKAVKNGPRQPQEARRSLNQIHALPAPVRIFPLPAFYPSNPVSLLYLTFAWLRQIISPPREPSLIHTGIWSPGSKSVHIQDWDSIRALWEHGFFGKGSLSRSEPNWYKGQLVKKGILEAHVSEIMTDQRREKRKQDKWERARLEQEAILQTKLKEAQESNSKPSDHASQHDSVVPQGTSALADELANGHTDDVGEEHSTITLQSALLSSTEDSGSNGHASTSAVPYASPTTDLSNGSRETGESTLSREGSDSGKQSPKKSVRFSPTVESTTFQPSEPPSPGSSSKNRQAANGLGLNIIENGVGPAPNEQTPTEEVIVNKEHLQLSLEEAFFLVFGLGVLQVVDDDKSVIPVRRLFDLFRRYSYFPPRVGPYDQALQPDDRFLVHYAAYHHFRSLGWVPRAGIKFGVDWLLYTRGPVFDHASYGLILVPSYTHPEWPVGKRDRKRTWSWFHGVSRTLSHAVKTLVLVYVDVPPPSVFDAALERGIADVFEQYKVREIIVRRWSSNRNR